MDDESVVETNPRDRDGVDPSAAFAEQANVSAADAAAFEGEWPDCWGRAGEMLEWLDPPEATFESAGDGGRWFPGGQLNASVDCVDRHLDDRKTQAAIKWIGKRGERRTYTYLDLYHEVNEFAAGLRSLGIGEGDVVTLYMPAIPELPIAMLACARIGAPHNVVFAGFSAAALAERMERADSEYLVTCDGYYRRGNAIHQKNKADNACLSVPHEVTETVVVERLDDESVQLGEGDRAYDDLLAAHRGAEVDPVARAANDPLFLIYTSGTTGEPTEVRHTTGGYLAHATWTSHAVLDLKPEDTYWCSADIGWITGHTYLVYGPLSLGTTTMLYEGTPDHPEKDRVWELIERNAVDVFYTAPTAIRAFMKWGAEHPDSHDLSSLRLLGSVGEPLNPSAWWWYYEHVGGGECPIVDTWWQTETGAILLSTLPGVDRMKPGSTGPPLPGIDVAVVGPDGEETTAAEGGRLAVTRPWPGMPLSLDGDERADEWRYVTEDIARIDEDGYVTVLGRIDDTVTVGNHRLGTTELERAIADVAGVAEAAIVDVRDGSDNSIFAFVSTDDRHEAERDLRERITDNVERSIGTFAVPETFVFTPELPKTRSGKLMRRLLKDIADDDELGDTSALRNPEIVGEIRSALDRE
ncbi:acetate--CoA ligase [Halosimplex pelagicum]|uniref:acetate--CoA ligase n=1 Tax=Halosimplex pelagicum TaxID=869886 RepID=A0A7D5TUX6_9EURY|nr:acetate--CoA ligase [Halosimplex pelagicum]QLH82754.1 acetate--CoA ligase [Halosimplex pelagicum]